MRDKFLVFGAPAIGEAEIEEVVAALRSRWIGTGPRVARFEADFAAYKGVARERVAAVGSCTAALHLSLIASGIGPGCEVLTTALTFCATVNAIIHAGATPVLVDVNPETMNIEPEAVARRIGPRTRALVPVHFAGYPCDMQGLIALAEQHQLQLIEDCAHAIESETHGVKCGTAGHFGCFSFYVTKNVITGEGGMVVARDADAIGRVKRLALHGMSQDAWSRFSDSGYKHYLVEECGFKYNMTDLQAAIGIHQLKRVEANWRRRREIWNRYQQAFRELPVALPPDPPQGVRHAYHLYTIVLDRQRAAVSRDEFLERMLSRRIGTGVHYLALPEHPYYRERFGWCLEDYPHAVRIGRGTASLPLSAALSDEDVEDVIAAVPRCLNV